MDSQSLTMTKIPRSRKDYLFVSMSLMMEILLGKTWLQAIYENRRKENPGWPTYKSLVKYSSGYESDLPSRPSSQLKLDSLMSYFSKRVCFSIVQDDFYWDRYSEWFGMLQGIPFYSEKTRNYWLNMLEEGRLLAFSLWNNRANPVASIQLYNNSDLVNKIGQPASRKILTDIFEIQVANKETGAYELEMAMTADKFTVVLRVMAWILADRLVGLDGNKLVAEIRNGDFLDLLLPRWDENNSSWSNPVRRLLERMAEISGCQKDSAFVPFLAEKWDVVERCMAKKTDLKDKERLIRMWVDDNKIAEPIQENLDSFMRALSAECGIYSDSGVLVDMYRFSISMRKIWHYLRFEEMLPDELLSGVFSVYSQEFHHADLILLAK